MLIEAKANEMEKEGFWLMSVTATGSAKAVPVFHKPCVPDEEPSKTSATEKQSKNGPESGRT